MATLRISAATLLHPTLRSRAVSSLSRPTTLQTLLHSRSTTLSSFSVLSRLNVQSSAFSTSFVARAASEVAGKPASQDLPHAAQNAKEEASAVASTLAKGIAGSGGKGDYDAAAVTRTQEATGADHSVQDSFSQITQAIASTVPQPILVMGLAGGLPYLGASLTTLYVSRAAAQSAAGLGSTDINSAIALLDSAMHFQVTYGAVMLSFLGALHWGMEFAKYDGYKGYSRLILGVAPLLAAWPTLTMEPQMALVAQWFLFTSLWYADMRATTAGWTPPWYSQYRFYLSILVGTCILGTLFGVNYLGPTTDVTLEKHIGETGVLGSSMGFLEHQVGGSIESAKKMQEKRYAPENAEYWTETGEDGWVKIMKKSTEEGEGEDEGEGEGEEGEESGDAEGEEKKSGSDDSDGEGEEKKDEGKGDDESKKDDEKPADDAEAGGDDEKKQDDGGEEKQDDGDKKKGKDAKQQKNPKAGETGENMDSAKRAKEEGVLSKRDGVSKAQ